MLSLSAFPVKAFGHEMRPLVFFQKHRGHHVYATGYSHIIISHLHATVALCCSQLHITHPIQFDQPMFKSLRSPGLPRFYFSCFFIVGNHRFGSGATSRSANF